MPGVSWSHKEKDFKNPRQMISFRKVQQEKEGIRKGKELQS